MNPEAPSDADPPAWAKTATFLGIGKVDRAHHDWLSARVADDAWVARSQWAFSALFVAVLGVGVWAVDGSLGTVVGALSGIVAANVLGARRLRRVRAEALRSLHGLGPKRSRFAGWSAATLLLFNVTVLVAVLGVAVAVTTS